MKINKIYLILILLLLSFSSVFAVDLCDNIIEPNSSCVMVTPFITCGVYDYNIYDENGSVVVSDSLSSFDNITGLYQFNISLNTGKYIIKLCDDTTREIVVSEDEDKMIGIILGILGIIAILLFIIFKLQINDFIKVVLMLVILFFSSIIPRLLRHFYNNQIMADLLKYYMWIIYAFTIYMFVYFIWSLFVYYGKTERFTRWIKDNFGNSKER